MTSILKPAALSVVLAALTAVAFDASAASIRVQCESRSGRAKISVDAKGLAAGTYRTQAMSGSNMAQSGDVTAVRGEIQTDYDSNPNDIAGGATAISSAFIVNGQATGKVVNLAGDTLLSDTVVCRVRN